MLLEISPSIVAIIVAAPAIVFALLAFVSAQWAMRKSASAEAVKALEVRITKCEESRAWQTNEIQALRDERNTLILDKGRLQDTVIGLQATVVKLQDRVLSLEKRNGG